MTTLARTTQTVNDRLVLSSERTPQINKTLTDSNNNLVMSHRWGLTTKQTGRLSVGRNISLTLTLSLLAGGRRQGLEFVSYQ
jgi:hypothetical protein